MTDRKLSIEDIAEPAKERVEFVRGMTGGIATTENILRCSDLWTSQHPIVPSEEDIEAWAATSEEEAKEGVEVWWQRRMYLRKEPAIPEGVKAILADYTQDDEALMLGTGMVREMVGKIVMLMQKEGK